MTSFLGRWPDFTKSDKVLSVTTGLTQLQVTGGLEALDAIRQIETYDKRKISGSTYNPEEDIMKLFEMAA